MEKLLIAGILLLYLLMKLLDQGRGILHQCIPAAYQMLEYSMGSFTVYEDSKRTEKNPLGLGCYLSLGGYGCSQLQLFLDTQKHKRFA